MTESIAHLPFPETAAAFEEIVAAGRPVVFDGAARDWPCTRDWSVEQLKRRLAGRETMVTLSNDRVFRGNPETGHYTAEQLRPMKWTDFLDSIAAGSAAGEHVYAHRQDVLGAFSELRQDIVVPRFVEGRSWLSVFLWMGPKGSVTQLHHDMTDNLFAMVRGRKKVHLFDPFQQASFYRFPLKAMNGRSSWHLSRLGTTDDVDLARFPAFAGAERLTVVVEPGDLLLIPSFWWHEVESLDQPSISLSYWWSDRSLAEIEGTLQKVTALAEEVASLPPAWRRFVLSVLERQVVRGEP